MSKDYSPIICIDFDGTIVDHRFPEIGEENPLAFRYMKEFMNRGARLILWTMRSDNQDCGDVLTDAVKFCQERGVQFWAVNSNPEQSSWTTSPKAHAHAVIDDIGACIPLTANPRGRPMVDWSIVGPAIIQKFWPEQK